MTEHGGTVRYHRAAWVQSMDRWEIQWVEDGGVDWFTAAEGEAMGLTPPEPESPALARVAELVDDYGATGVGLALLAHDDVTNVDDFLDELLNRWMRLRDARQDPQPASDPLIALTFSDVADSDEQPWPVAQPEQDDTPGIDFDALPIGTVLQDREKDYWVKLPDRWIEVEDHVTTPEAFYAPYTVVYQPAPLSPGQCLRGLLAGGDDADELIKYAATFIGNNATSDGRLRRILGDAAREVHG